MKFLYSINKDNGVRTIVGGFDFKFDVYEAEEGTVSIRVNYDGKTITVSEFVGLGYRTRIEIVNAISEIMTILMRKYDRIDLNMVIDTAIKKVIGDTHSNETRKQVYDETVLEVVIDGLDTISDEDGKNKASHACILKRGNGGVHLAIRESLCPDDGSDESVMRVIARVTDLLIPFKEKDRDFNVYESGGYIIVGRSEKDDDECQKWKPLSDAMTDICNEHCSPERLYYQIGPYIKLCNVNTIYANRRLEALRDLYDFEQSGLDNGIMISNIKLK